MIKGTLVLQGGGIRGVFTSGVLDVLLENDIMFSDVVGVSAGALNGVNYVSRQLKRSFRTVHEHTNDKKFASLKNFAKTGSYFNSDYIFFGIPDDSLKFDSKTFYDTETNFWCGATNMNTGETDYFKKEDSKIFWDALSASMSMPLISKPVIINDVGYLDGGTADPIPYKKALKDNTDIIVVVLTRERTFRKKDSGRIPRISYIIYKEFPKFIDALLNYAKVYNAQMDELIKLEKENKIFIIAPDKPVDVRRTEKNVNKIKDLYEEGRQIMEKNMQKLKEYMKL